MEVTRTLNEYFYRPQLHWSGSVSNQYLENIKQNNKQLPFSMNRNQGVIHLGRSKSPEHLKKGFYQVVMPQGGEVTTILRKRSPVHQNSLANTMYIESRGEKSHEDQTSFAKTHQGVFRPSREKQNDFGMSIEAENKLAGLGRGSRKQLTQQNSVLGYAHTNSVNQSYKPICSDKQIQMGRKILLLESRIEQLHKEKQSCIMRAHQQNKRLVIENSHLQALLAQYDSIKNQFMINQIQFNALNSPNKSPKPSFVPIQYSSLRQEDEDDKTSITFDIDQKNSLISKINQTNVKQSQIEGLRIELRSAQAKILEIIQLKEENQKLTKSIKELENKNNDYSTKIQALKASAKSDHANLKSKNQFLNLALEQSQFYVSKLLSTKQQMMRKDDELKLQKAQTIQVQKQLTSKIIQLEQKIKVLTEKSVQGCQKCSNLMKALVKMNQRVYVTGPTK